MFDELDEDGSGELTLDEINAAPEAAWIAHVSCQFVPHIAPRTWCSPSSRLQGQRTFQPFSYLGYLGTFFLGGFCCHVRDGWPLSCKSRIRAVCGLLGSFGPQEMLDYDGGGTLETDEFCEGGVFFFFFIRPLGQTKAGSLAGSFSLFYMFCIWEMGWVGRVADASGIYRPSQSFCPDYQPALG